MGNKVLRSIYVDIAQLEALKRLSEETRVAQAVYIREGIDHVLQKYQGGKCYGVKKSS